MQRRRRKKKKKMGFTYRRRHRDVFFPFTVLDILKSVFSSNYMYGRMYLGTHSLARLPASVHFCRMPHRAYISSKFLPRTKLSKPLTSTVIFIILENSYGTIYFLPGVQQSEANGSYARCSHVRLIPPLYLCISMPHLSSPPACPCINSRSRASFNAKIATPFFLHFSSSHLFSTLLYPALPALPYPSPFPIPDSQPRTPFIQPPRRHRNINYIPP